MRLVETPLIVRNWLWDDSSVDYQSERDTRSAFLWVIFGPAFAIAFPFYRLIGYCNLPCIDVKVVAVWEVESKLVLQLCCQMHALHTIRENFLK